MALTYEPIVTYTVPSATPSHTFTSITQSYTDLVLIMAMAPGTATNFDIQVGNGSADTGSNYVSTRMLGNGSTASGDRQLSNFTGILGNVDNSTTVVSTYIVQFLNYTNTTTHKQTISRGNRSDSYVIGILGSWRSTSAINTIKIHSTNGSNIPAGCVFTLYGILKA
jgi:hypothetical protein